MTYAAALITITLATFLGNIATQLYNRWRMRRMEADAAWARIRERATSEEDTQVDHQQRCNDADEALRRHWRRMAN